MQAQIFRDADADMVTAITMTYPEEAIGIVRAAQAAAMPVAISFTVETDGRLPNGQALADAIAQVDGATGNAPAYYMINCAHPSHFADVLEKDLDEATSLDSGDPIDLAKRYREFKTRLSHLNVFGGCCGTDHRHIDAICQAVLS